MLWSAPHPPVSTYRVEVSGWDSAQSFFVEAANLEWDEASSKNITLGRSLCPERWSLCAYYFPPRRSALFPWPIKPNISRPPRRDTNGSASNRFILVQERMNHQNNKLRRSNGAPLCPFWIWSRAVPDWEAANHFCTKLA